MLHSPLDGAGDGASRVLSGCSCRCCARRVDESDKEQRGAAVTGHNSGTAEAAAAARAPDGRQMPGQLSNILLSKACRQASRTA